MIEYFGLMMEAASLRVMYPGCEDSDFKCVLQGPENFKRWQRGFENLLVCTNSRLTDYYCSERNIIADDDTVPLKDCSASRKIRLKYNYVLLGMLRCSTSDDIRKNIEESFDELAVTDDNPAKTIITELGEKYGTMTFAASFKLTSQFLKNCRNGYSEELQQDYNGCMLALETPILFKSGMLLYAGNEYVKEEMLRTYGRLSTFDEHEFSSTFRKLMAESSKSSSPSIQSNNRQTRRRSKLPPSPCPLCSGNHWKFECPNLPTVADEATVSPSTFRLW